MAAYPLLAIQYEATNDIPAERLVNVPPFSVWGGSVEQRENGLFGGKAIYLTDKYEWRLGQDQDGAIILVPLKTS